MRNGKTVLAQMQEIISRYNFEKLILLHKGDKSVKFFTSQNLFTVMLYAQMTTKMSLRDICDGLRSKVNFWYHLALQSISRNNLSHALKTRSQEIFAALFYHMLGKLTSERGMRNDKRFRFKNQLHTIDSTTISLCLSLFEWARFRRSKGGIKLHIMFNNKQQLPEFINMTEAKCHDINAAYNMPVRGNCIYVIDRGYFCYDFFEKLRKNRAFFVIRTKSNTRYRIVERRKKSDPCIKADWIVAIAGNKSEEYHEHLRVVRYYDREKKETFEYYTNNFSLSAKTIADIYKARWGIECFFKFIKQNLKIKTFFGTSQNAVMIQIWTAMIALLLVEYIRFKCHSTFSLYQAWRILKDNVFQQYCLEFLMTELSPTDNLKNDISCGQMVLCF
jgi:transposase